MQKAMHLERQYRELEQHSEFLAQEMIELSAFYEQLESLNKSNSMSGYSTLGKGVYLPANYTSKQLLVEVGLQIFVQKTPEEVQQVVEAQIKKLQATQETVNVQINMYLEALSKLLDNSTTKDI